MDEIHLQGSLFSADQTTITTDDYYTPRWLFELLNITFDIDVAAPPGGVPWIPATRHFSLGDDGLTQRWEGRIWMNPPFSKMTPWVEKFLDHGNGIALLPFGKSKWFGKLWSSDATLVALPSDFEFKRGDQYLGIRYPTCLVALSDECAEAVAQVGRTR